MEQGKRWRLHQNFTYCYIVSVIVPIYKTPEKLLHACLKSIINQTYKNLEIILIDDGSPDNCPKICDEYAEKDIRIKVIHKQNSGVSAARNTGLKIAKGEYIQFVDSDDWIDSNMIEKMLEKIEKNKADLVICGFKVHKMNGYIAEKKYIDFIIKTKEDLSKHFLFLYSKYLIQLSPNKLYKKECIYDYFDENMSYGEDTKFVVQFIEKNKKIVIIKDTFYNYIELSNGLSKQNKKIELDFLILQHNMMLNFCKNQLIEYTDLTSLNEYFIKYILIRMRTLINSKEIIKKKKIDILKEWVEIKEVKEAIKGNKFVNNKINIGSKLIYSKKIHIIYGTFFIEVNTKKIIYKFKNKFKEKVNNV